MKEEIKEVIAGICQAEFDRMPEVELARPEGQFGDYSSNVALQLAAQLNKNPREVAETIKEKLDHPHLKSVEIAGPGFLNLTLSDEALLRLTNKTAAQTLKGQTIVAEYSDPNPFKILHAGHLYTSVVGDAISNLLEVAGGKVFRVNFGGDVGLHVAKTLHVVLTRLGGEKPEALETIDHQQRSDWLASAYIEGTNLYESDEEVGREIVRLNKRIYQIHEKNDHDSPLAQIYWTTRQWSYEYFDSFYKQIGSRFDKYYPESQTASIGLQTVQSLVGKVFEESDGAVIFDGEKFGLHKRVFITSEGLPTYEAKDIGLLILKKQDFDFDQSIVITGNEQQQYMAVVLKAIEQFEPEMAQASLHITHGMVRLKGGQKMSSRKGNILKATDILDEATKASQKLNQNDQQEVILAAVKYAFLKNRTGGDIIYDPIESVALEGNSGPYLQYAHARARSILAKKNAPKTSKGIGFDQAERKLVKKIGEFSEVVDEAAAALMPHYICTYLYELAQTFNNFYEHSRVIGDDREAIRLQLVSLYADALKNGLKLLNIHAPDKM